MYSFIITFLRQIEAQIMSMDESAEIIQLIKDYTFQYRDNKETEKVYIDWNNILSRALDLVHDL